MKMLTRFYSAFVQHLSIYFTSVAVLATYLKSAGEVFQPWISRFLLYCHILILFYIFLSNFFSFKKCLFKGKLKFICATNKKYKKMKICYMKIDKYKRHKSNWIKITGWSRAKLIFNEVGEVWNRLIEFVLKKFVNNFIKFNLKKELNLT